MDGVAAMRVAVVQKSSRDTKAHVWEKHMKCDSTKSQQFSVAK